MEINLKIMMNMGTNYINIIENIIFIENNLINL